MGSLPNLHELCSKEDEEALNRHQGHHLQQHYDKTKTNPTAPVNKTPIAHQKVQKSRSNGNGQAQTHIWDDMMLEQMATYSPISNRSTRNAIRRRDSMNSSIGATSVRRLITVVRNTHSRYGPVYSKKLLIRNLFLACVTHLVVCATVYPFLALQSSVTVWFYPLPHGNPYIPPNTNIGSLLIALTYFFGSFSILVGPSFVQKFGTNSVLYVFYVTLVLFFGSHFYPVLFVLVPVYVMLGLAIGPALIGRITFLMTVSMKLNSALSEEDDDAKNRRRICLIRRVARSFRAAQDLGLILGSILTALIVSCTFDAQNFVFKSNDNSTFSPVNNVTILNVESAVPPCGSHFETNDVRNYSCNRTNFYEESLYVIDYTKFMDSIFDADETGDRLCGSEACPSYFFINFNFTERNYPSVLPAQSADILTGMFVGFALFTLIVAVMGLDRIRLYIPQDPLERSEGLAALKAVRESFKDFKLQLAAPLAVFIGMEQAFIFADFSKSYVVCTLGIDRLNLVFLCMGLLQSIAACTLSMLLRSIQRYIVIMVGFTFHACLLMVQLLWKPSGDDPALFYVISAAWGVCNAIWEMLNFTLLTGAYTDSYQSAFANSYFFRHLGMAFAFAVHGLLCNWIKLYLLAATMILATIPYTWLEIKLENIRRMKNISRL